MEKRDNTPDSPKLPRTREEALALLAEVITALFHRPDNLEDNPNLQRAWLDRQGYALTCVNAFFTAPDSSKGPKPQKGAMTKQQALWALMALHDQLRNPPPGFDAYPRQWSKTRGTDLSEVIDCFSDIAALEAAEVERQKSSDISPITFAELAVLSECERLEVKAFIQRMKTDKPRQPEEVSGKCLGPPTAQCNTRASAQTAKELDQRLKEMIENAPCACKWSSPNPKGLTPCTEHREWRDRAITEALMRAPKPCGCTGPDRGLMGPEGPPNGDHVCPAHQAWGARVADETRKAVEAERPQQTGCGCRWETDVETRKEKLVIVCDVHMKWRDCCAERAAQAAHNTALAGLADQITDAVQVFIQRRAAFRGS